MFLLSTALLAPLPQPDLAVSSPPQPPSETVLFHSDRQGAQKIAQGPVTPAGRPDLPPEPEPPELEPLPPLPPPEELLQPPAAPEALPPNFDVPGTIVVQAFRVVGSTIFSAEELATVTAAYTNRPITFTELLEARSAVTQLYLDSGYITTGAFIPTEQVIDEGIVEIQVVEGFLEAVVIEGLEDLVPGYVSSRIERAAGRPLNVNDLVEGLQLLQLDPVIESISAELATGTQLGGSIVNLQVEEAKSFSIEAGMDNGRSPTVGSVRGQASLRDINLLGFGDTLDLAYSLTAGSDTVNIGYTLPVSPSNTTVGLNFSLTRSEVIDDDFDILSIESASEDLQLSLRQPIVQTPTEELALSLGFAYSRIESTFQLPGAPRLGFPFTGAPDGEAKVTAIRFGQEWTQRSASRVLAARSTFNLGADWLGGTNNEGDIPDSNFFSWQGQAQWVQVLATDTLLLARIDGQLADRPLLSLEQFRLGGQGSVRGYREDEVIADNGVFASLEVRVPILRIPEWESLVQLTPFVDVGYAWNSGDSPDPESQTLASVGVGALWQVSDRVTARLDYGIPLINEDDIGNSLQESGILFSITGRVF
ncbi:MAG: ShlB/FhaC/HecB family hemolysin secretion/activation protein [Leptolyngbya sp. SIO1E4]|nr:ShlB/FhaC/HecB family hemolysin secretion/activation protein [Leptolyngbya sp. SIO1E4]